MSDVVEAIEDFASSAYDFIEDTVKTIWDDVAVPALEEIFSWFGIVDETVFVVNKTSILLFGDNTEDVIQAANVKAAISMVSNGGSFFPWYLQHTQETRASITAFYRYAEQGWYVHGLPEMTIKGVDTDYVPLDAALNTDLGFSATRLSSHSMIPSDLVYFKHWLQASPYLYRPWENRLTHLDALSVSYDDWWLVDITYNAGPDTWSLNIQRETSPSVYETAVITRPGYIPESSMIVTYHADADPSTEWYYWIYKYSDNTYTGITPAMGTLSQLEMLPVGILRKDKVSVNSDRESDEYITARKLLARLSIDIEEVIANIEESPSSHLVDDAFINFSVSPSSTAEIVSKMLWLTYYNIIVIHSLTSNSNQYSAAFSEQDVQNATVWRDHSHTTGIAGTLASGQEYEHEIEYIPEESEYDPDLFETVITQEEGSNLYIRHQTSPGVYSEMIISGLNGMAAIEYNGYHNTAFNKLGDEQFTIPVSHYVLNELDQYEQMLLYQHMLRIDLYSNDLIDLAWYETSAFYTLFEFAMIVITIFTFGAATSVWQVLQQLVVNYLIIQAVIYIAEITGNAELAAIVGLAAMIALQGPAGIGFDISTAEGLIQASTQFANNLTVGYNTLTDELADDILDISDKAAARLDEIEDATPEESPITAEFLVSLNSVDTTAFPAIKAQYDFDLLYNYDRIIKDYHTLNLMTGVN